MSTWGRCVGHVPIWTHVRNGYLWLLSLLPFLSKFCFVSIPVTEFLLCGKWMLDLICLHFYFFFFFCCCYFVLSLFSLQELRLKYDEFWFSHSRSLPFPFLSICPCLLIHNRLFSETAVYYLCVCVWN